MPVLHGRRGGSGVILQRIVLAAVLAAGACATWGLARNDARIDVVASRGSAPERLPDEVTGLQATSVTIEARRRLRQRPIDAAAFRMLAAAADAQGEAARALTLAAIAARRNPRDIGAQAVLVRSLLDAGRPAEAVGHLDPLLRVAPEAGRPLLERMIQGLDDPMARRALVSRVALDPPWRPLLANALASSADPEAIEAFLSTLDASSPLGASEVGLRADNLVRMGRSLEARQVWERALPPAARAFSGLVHDGGFETGEGPVPYGWQLESPAGAVIGLDRHHAYRGSSSLGLVFSGRAVDFSGVRQRMALAPGRYRLAGAADSMLQGGELPFAWVITCRDDGKPLARLPLVTTTVGWHRFEVAFQVPAACSEQDLVLARDARTLRERQLSGRLYLDDVTIRRLTP